MVYHLTKQKPIASASAKKSLSATKMHSDDELNRTDTQSVVEKSSPMKNEEVQPTTEGLGSALQDEVETEEQQVMP